MANTGGVYTWSQTAANNGTADNTVNWAEGMAPSQVNNSARAEMASVAKWRDDISGAIVTAGTSTAYTVSSYQVFDTLADMNGQVIAFSPHATNGAVVTLNVDGLGAKPLRSAPNADLLAGVLVQGTPYVAVYNNSDGAFYLRNYYGQPYAIPLAGGMDYWGSTAPNSCFAFPTGQAISRATYATLYALIGTTYGSGDGSTTFNLPDKTGRVSAMKESVATRLTSSWFGGNSANLGATGGNEKNALSSTNQLPQFTPSGTNSGGAVSFSATIQNSGVSGANGPFVTSIHGANDLTTSIVPTVTQPTFSGNPIGSSSPASFATTQPTIVCNYIMRII